MNNITLNYIKNTKNNPVLTGYHWVESWLFSTNAKQIGILYGIFSIFAGLAGLSFSVLMRLELASPNPQILMHNGQLWNGAPSNYVLMIELVTKLVQYKHLIFIIILFWYKNYCIKHRYNLKKANFEGTIALPKRGTQYSQAKCIPLVKLMNPYKAYCGVTVPLHHLDEITQVDKLYVSVYLLVFIVLAAIYLLLYVGDLKNTRYIKHKNSGLTERGNPGVNGGSVVPITRKKNSSLVCKRFYNTIGKGTRQFSSEDNRSAGLKELEHLIKNNNIKDNKIFHLVSNRDILILAYQKIRSKPGNMTPSFNNITLDGIDLKYFDNLSKDLISGKFKFSPVRLVEIPKPKGGIRPLSVGNPREKIVQEAMRMILDIIFDNKMSDYSHGFRPNRSCSTAIWQVRNTFAEVIWFIEVDLKKCFDTIPHKVIVSRIKEFVKDEQFIDLLFKLLRAGYYTPSGVYHKTKVGVPQGSIVSPLLANIVLGLVDNFLDDLKLKYTRGNQRKLNKDYVNLSSRLRRSKRFSDRIILHKERSLLRARLANDTNYKRFKYVRYADDILIGVIGSFKDCLNIKLELSNFLDSIGLSLNQDKTLITNSKKKASFLGFDINITPHNKRPIISKKYNKTLVKGIATTRPIINAPIRNIVLKLEQAGFCKGGIVGIPTRCGRLIHEELHVIVNYYKSILFGILNYYRIATNFTTLKWRVYYILFYSCILTFASKLKLHTKRKVLKKFGPNLEIVKVINGKNVLLTDFSKLKIFNNLTKVDDHFEFVKSVNKNVLNPDEYLDLLIYRLPRTISSFGDKCSICGSNENLEMHHMKHIKKRGIKQDYLSDRMRKMNRKQIPLCKNCHIKLHQGKSLGPGL